jgi:GNAT superfamily N-acetyltransferase
MIIAVAASPVSLVELPRASNPQAVDLLVSAYRRDAGFARAFWAADEAPVEALRALFTAAHARQIARIPPLALVASGGLVAIAGYWLPAARGSLNPALHLRAWWTSVLALARLPHDVRRRLAWYNRAANRLLPLRPRCLVTHLAVEPSEQGQGHARTLLAAVRDRSRADRWSTGIGITTYSEANVKLYEHLGFRVTGHRSERGTQCWGLFTEH